MFNPMRSSCARSQSITDAIQKAQGQIEAIEHAYQMLEGYSYELEALVMVAERESEVEVRRGEAAE